MPATLDLASFDLCVVGLERPWRVGPMGAVRTTPVGGTPSPERLMQEGDLGA